MDTSNLLAQVKAIAPAAYETSTSLTHICYHLRTRDSDLMQRILELFDAEIRDKRLVSYSIFGTTIEEIFLSLMKQHDRIPDEDGHVVSLVAETPAATTLADLPMGRSISPLEQSLTIFHKRLLITKRSSFTWLMTSVVAICGACIPLIFMGQSWPGCLPNYIYPNDVPLYLPNYTSYLSFLSPGIGLQSPPVLSKH